MTRKEAKAIKTQLYVSTQLLANMADDYPEVMPVQVAANKIEDAAELIEMFFNGLIFQEDRRP